MAEHVRWWWRVTRWRILTVVAGAIADFTEQWHDQLHETPDPGCPMCEGRPVTKADIVEVLDRGRINVVEDLSGVVVTQTVEAALQAEPLGLREHPLSAHDVEDVRHELEGAAMDAHSGWLLWESDHPLSFGVPHAKEFGDCQVPACFRRRAFLGSIDRRHPWWSRGGRAIG